MNAPMDLAARRAALVAALAPLLPAHALLHQPEQTTPYECDGLTAYRQRPLAVALPETEAQVAAVLKACHRLGVPVVARGAGTGLSGGAMPHEAGVTLALAKFNKILSVGPLSRTARVQCGVRNLAISEAAAAHGLYLSLIHICAGLLLPRRDRHRLMPIVDVCWIGEAPPAELAQRLADAVGDALNAAPGRAWVRLQHLPAEHYAENGDPQLGALPVFARILHARPPAGAAWHAEVAALTAALARVTGRPPERVHLEYAPAGAGRVAFGGRVIEA